MKLFKIALLIFATLLFSRSQAEAQWTLTDDTLNVQLSVNVGPNVDYTAMFGEVWIGIERSTVARNGDVTATGYTYLAWNGGGTPPSVTIKSSHLVYANIFETAPATVTLAVSSEALGGIFGNGYVGHNAYVTQTFSQSVSTPGTITGVAEAHLSNGKNANGFAWWDVHF
jgi:hypothetical protein